MQLWQDYHNLGDNKYGSDVESELFSYFLDRHRLDINGICYKNYRYNYNIKDDLISFCHTKLLSAIRKFKNYKTTPFVFLNTHINYAVIDFLRKNDYLNNQIKREFFKYNFPSIHEIEVNLGCEFAETKYAKRYTINDIDDKVSYQELKKNFYDFCKLKKYKKSRSDMLFNLIINNWEQSYYVEKLKCNKSYISRLKNKAEKEFIEFYKSKIRTAENKRIIASL